MAKLGDVVFKSTVTVLAALSLLGGISVSTMMAEREWVERDWAAARRPPPATCCLPTTHCHASPRAPRFSAGFAFHRHVSSGGREQCLAERVPAACSAAWLTLPIPCPIPHPQNKVVAVVDGDAAEAQPQQPQQPQQ